MGPKFQVFIFICCLCLIDQTTGMRGGKDKDSKQGAGRCKGWEIDLRNNLTDPGNISEYINDFYENISDLSPGCVRSFSLNVTHSNLVELMKLLNAKYDYLNPGTRKQIYKWVEDIYTKTPGPGMDIWKPKPHERKSKNPDESNNPEKGKGKGKKNWITLNVLNILGRFIVQAPTSTLESIAMGKNNTVCQLFKTSSDLLDRLFDLTPVQARIFLKGLYNCVDVDTKSETVIANLGQLVCFYPTKQLKSLSMKAIKALQDKLRNCTRNTKKIYRALVEVIGVNISSAENLKELGAAAIGLKISQLSNLKKEVVVGAIEELKNVRGWSKGQAKVFVKKYMEAENVTAEKLKKLGYLTFGFGAKTFRKFKALELLTAFTNKEVSESVYFMLPVQKNLIVERILESVEIDSALELLPETLVSEIPVKQLLKAGKFSNLDFVNKNRPWNKGQSVVAIDRVKDQLNDVKNISKLKAVVKGIPCSLINTLKPDVVKALANNPLVSSNQIRCFSIKFFKDKKTSNSNYFSRLTQEDIDEFLISYMIFQPEIKELKLIPRDLCPNMVELISQANITMLPRSSPRRKELLDYAKDCLNLTASAMTEDEGNSLGSLVCAFSPNDINNLNNTVFLAIVDQLRECGRFDEAKKIALRQKILSAYPPLIKWTVDELTELRGLLAVLMYEDFKSIPNNDDIQTALLEILSSYKSTKNFVPPDFDNSPNVSALYQKVFSMLNNASENNRRKRAPVCSKRPTEEDIESLGEANILWTVEQLMCISVEDFINSLDTLTQVEGFNIDQLKALKSKALESFSNKISNDQLASLRRITLGFDENEVTQYFTAPDIDTIGAISDNEEWASTEYSSRAKTIVKNFLGQRSDNELSSADLVAMGYFLCTRSPNEIKNISMTAYSNAAQEIGETMCPNIETITALKNKAVETFPSVDTWTGAELQEIGVVAAGLSAEEVSKLMTSAVSFLKPGAVSKIPPKIFSAMTMEQLRNLGPRNYGAVTDAQKAALSKEKLQALQENAGFERAIDNTGAIFWNPVMILTLLVLSLTATLH
ncbi:otoancorin-like [Hemiscyllium ocellatum]|uniref:otoancorin-like n=1 Tax=Hemiscyllium ocellatum TaxID=170820 RepID=UPI0029674C6D|nr:otoancorin-like [Hemiscyllium ocellatum]